MNSSAASRESSGIPRYEHYEEPLSSFTAAIWYILFLVGAPLVIWISSNIAGE